MPSGPDEIRVALGILEELAVEGPLFDIHVHPFNIADPVPLYTESTPSQKGVFGQGAGDYVAPEWEPEKMADDPENGNEIKNRDLVKKFNLLKSRSLYKFTGPGVFRDHMTPACISHVLLLPVALPRENGDSQITEMARIFGGQEGFSLGYSVPNDCQASDIVGRVGEVKERFKISALKIQTAITGIDPGSPNGLERLHLILEASREHSLPVIIHGGYTREFVPARSEEFGCLDRLQRVEWNATDQPVVIAHAGFFGCGREEVENSSLSRISTLLAKYDHLLVDVAGLKPWALEIVMERMDGERILFGSDALYNSIGNMVLRSLKTMMKTGRDARKMFRQIACINPGRHFFPDIPTGKCISGEPE